MAPSPRLVLRAYVPQPDASFLEWLAYHRALGGARHGDAGTTDILIFTDREPFASHTLLNALATEGIITLSLMESNDKEDFGAYDRAGNYGLAIAPDEYLCIDDRDSGLDAFLGSSTDAESGDLRVPVRVAGMSPGQGHTPGAILQLPRAIAPAGNDAQVRLIRKLGASNEAGPDSAASQIAAALVVKIPAPTIETFLLRQQMLPAKDRDTVQIQTKRLNAYAAINTEPLSLETWRGATARQIATLLALPGIAEAYQNLCAAETAACEKLRASSPDFQQDVARCGGVPASQSEQAAKATQNAGADALLQAEPDVKDDADPVSQTDVQQPDTNPSTPEPDPHPDAIAKLPLWFSEIHMGGAQEGFYTRLKNHAVVCIRRDPARLIVTFDNLSNIDDTSPDREPWAYKFVRDNGCSHLSVIARRKDWYRDLQLIRYLQRLSADGFFAEFEKVIFSGTSMGGFAALTFSSLAPGATVISFSPQTTLEEALVPWETRFAPGRARDWSLPHSDCAYEIDDVKKAFVLYDPFFEPDRRHVERLENPNVVYLKTWCSGHFSPVFLRRAGLLKPLMQHAVDETLTPQVFYDMFRARRKLPWYRKSLISNLQDRGHHKLAARVTPAFRKLRRQAAE